MNIEGENVPVFDEFPYEHLFSLATHTPWFVDIANYLAIGELPQHLSSKEEQRIIRLSATYSWMGGDLYKTCLDLIIRRCVREDEMHDILKASHDGHCGVIFKIREQPIRLYTQVTTGLLCSEMQKGMFKVATIVKGWGNPSREMKCLCSPRFS